MGSDRKRRPDSLAATLLEKEVYEEFCELIFGQGWRYEDLLEHLEKWGISSSMGALSRFWDGERSAWALERAKRYAAQELDAPGLEEAQRKVIAERMFSLAASPHISEKALLKMRELEIKGMQLANDSRRIAILEGKLKEASDKLQELRDPAKADDATMRARILDEVDRAMGIKH